MRSSPDPKLHQACERQFVAHVERLLEDDRLRLDTVFRPLLGRRSLRHRPVTLLTRRVSKSDRGAELKRLMSEMGRPDRELQEKMPIGQSVEVELIERKLRLFNTVVGRLKAVCISPSRALVAGQKPATVNHAELERLLNQTPPPVNGVPETVVVLATSGFERQAHELAERRAGRTVILVEPNDTGGFNVTGPGGMAELTALFDPEGEEDKRQRVREAIAHQSPELTGSGIAADRLAGKLELPIQLVESEIRSYAKSSAGLVAKKLDGRMVLFREGSMATADAPGGLDMPMIDRIKSLFARRGENEKKIAFLSERRAALGQQRDRAYEEIASLETKDADLRKQFKEAPADLAKRRITSQLLQMRKDMERRQQLLGVLNQQINVVSTHLHNLELVQQGATAKLPNSEEMASDAAAAEEMLAKLEADTELADSVGSVASAGMSAEEQALFEELQKEAGEAKAAAEATKAKPAGAPSLTTSAKTGAPLPLPTSHKAHEREAGEAEAG